LTRSVTIRPLATAAEYAACVALQRETWGASFADTVPASILKVSQRMGGIASGAFDAAGALLGFVYGLTGVEQGQIVHWSDMLAVRPDAQNLGLGRRLKEHQRDAMKAIGARVIYWTYDPLVARNAHLNFNVFGVRVVEYARDMYGTETGSDLHRGIGTDRLVVAWPVPDTDLSARRGEIAATRDSKTMSNSPVLADVERPIDVAVLASRPSELRIAVPLDIGLGEPKDAALARRWRASTRAAFEGALAGGYVVSGFTLDADRGRGFYLLTLNAAPEP
jgi:chorismate synthase